MTFSDQEYSIAEGRPARLYLFERGPAAWAYTSADRDIRFQTRDYRAVPISDDGIRQTGETSADALTLTGPDDLEVVGMFIGHPPSDEIWLTIRDFHHGLADADDNALIVWIGTVQAVRWTAPGQTEIVCQTLSASMGRNALRLAYERNCPHTIYDMACRVSRALHQVQTTITALDGASVTVAGLPSSNYAGGYIEWATPSGVVERRGIEAQSGFKLTLLSGTAGLKAGQAISAFPGCDQTRAMCSGTYANLDNYGGFAHLPGISPFENNPFF